MWQTVVSRRSVQGNRVCRQRDGLIWTGIHNRRLIGLRDFGIDRTGNVGARLVLRIVCGQTQHVSSGGAKAPIGRGLICIRKGDDACSADLAQKDETLQNAL